MIRLATIVVHDTRRADRLDRLLARLAPVVTDDGAAFTPTAVSGGSGLGPWAGMVQAIGSAPIWGADGRADQATHVLLVEDDAEPCDSFTRHVLAATRARPLDVLSLFSTRDQAGWEMDAAASADLSWAPVVSGPVGALAMVLPAPSARRFLRYWSAYNDAEFRRLNRGPAGNAGDARLWWFFVRVCGQALMVSRWSLVGHGCDGPADSLVHEEPQHPRRAYRPVHGVTGEGPAEDRVPAGTIDWTRGASIDARMACWEAA